MPPVSSSVSSDGSFSFEVRDPIDAVWIREHARKLCSRTGFNSRAAGELAIVVSELSTNIACHAGSGTVLARPISADGRVGVEVVARDAGPGIRDVARALQDGVSGRKGSMGAGLGAVNRLADDVDFVTDATGTQITIRKWCNQGGSK